MGTFTDLQSGCGTTAVNACRALPCCARRHREARFVQVIVGQDDVLDQVLIALFVGGHVPV